MYCFVMFIWLTSEDEACPVEDLFGKISLAVQISSTFPLLSLEGQDKFCRFVNFVCVFVLFFGVPNKVCLNQF